VKHGRRDLTLTILPSSEDEQQTVRRIARATAILLNIAARLEKKKKKESNSNTADAPIADAATDIITNSAVDPSRDGA